MQVTLSSFIDDNYDIHYQSECVQDVEDAEEIIVITNALTITLTALFINTFATDKDAVLLDGPFMEEMDKKKHYFGVWLNDNIPTYGTGINMEACCSSEKLNAIYNVWLSAMVSSQELVRDHSIAREPEIKEQIESQFKDIITKALDYIESNLDLPSFVEEATAISKKFIPQMFSEWKKSVVLTREKANRTFIIAFVDPQCSEEDSFPDFYSQRKLITLYPKNEKTESCNPSGNALFEALGPSVIERIINLFSSFMELTDKFE